MSKDKLVYANSHGFLYLHWLIYHTKHHRFIFHMYFYIQGVRLYCLPLVLKDKTLDIFGKTFKFWGKKLILKKL